MKLYLVKQAYQGYDTYDSMVVAAENEEDAYRLSCICAGVYGEIGKEVSEHRIHEWAIENDMLIICIAESTNQPEGIVCASFNAG